MDSLKKSNLIKLGILFIAILICCCSSLNAQQDTVKKETPDQYNERALAVADSIFDYAFDNFKTVQKMCNILTYDNKVYYYLTPFAVYLEDGDANKNRVKLKSRDPDSARIEAKKLLDMDLKKMRDRYDKKDDYIFNQLYRSVSQPSDDKFSKEIKALIVELLVVYRKSVYMYDNFDFIPNIFFAAAMGILDLAGVKARLTTIKIDNLEDYVLPPPSIRMPKVIKE